MNHVPHRYINPFMSCSARLPVYVLMAGTFFPAHEAVVFMGLYVLGIIVAVVTARLMRRFYFKKDETPFVMELPPYRVPTLKALVRHMWGKGEQYLRKMGGIILFASIIVWVLNYLKSTSHKHIYRQTCRTGHKWVYEDCYYSA